MCVICEKVFNELYDLSKVFCRFSPIDGFNVVMLEIVSKDVDKTVIARKRVRISDLTSKNLVRVGLL